MHRIFVALLQLPSLIFLILPILFLPIDPLHAFNINIATVAIRHVGEPRPNYCARKNCIMAAALLTGYSLAIADRYEVDRYEAKIQQIDGVDQYNNKK